MFTTYTIENNKFVIESPDYYNPEHTVRTEYDIRIVHGLLEITLDGKLVPLYSFCDEHVITYIYWELTNRPKENEYK